MSEANGDRDAIPALVERPAPQPSPEFDAALGNSLRGQADDFMIRPRPERLRGSVLAYALAGTGLLGVAALGLAGVGPLA